MFAALPTSFPLLEEAAATLDRFQLGSPPDMRAIGERVYSEFMSDREQGFSNVRSSRWKLLPFALWIGDDEALIAQPSLIGQYFRDRLRPVATQPKRASRWVRPIVFCYVEQFRVSDSKFSVFSEIAKAFIAELGREKSPTLYALQQDFSFFDPTQGPLKFSQGVIESRGALEEWIESVGLWAESLNSRFLHAAYEAALKMSESTRRDPESIERLMQWSIGESGLRYPADASALADALLLPWVRISPEENVKSRIIDFLVKYLKDPRTNPGPWRNVSENGRAIILRWLTGRTLDLFFRVLEATADEIWEYRQRFWKSYYDRGHLAEAWVVLGADARRYARKMQNVRDVRCGRLNGGTPDQSVLLMRIGSIVFSEWSHNGRLRAQHENAPDAPRLYQDWYIASELRGESLDFNDEQLQDPGLVHFSSAAGGWQSRARKFIKRQLGIEIPQRETVL